MRHSAPSYRNYIERRLADPSDYGRIKAEAMLYRETDLPGIAHQKVVSQWPSVLEYAEKVYEVTLRTRQLESGVMTETTPHLIPIASIYALPPSVYPRLWARTLIAIDAEGQWVIPPQPE